MTDSEPPPLNEDQRALQDTLRAFLADQLPPEALRAALETQAGYSPDLHARLAGELGLVGLTIPAEFGGFARSQAEASVMHAELGRALYPGPFLPSALTAGVLLAAGDRAAQEQWLPLLARGTVTGTVAAAGEAGFWSPGPDSVRAMRAPGGLAALRPPLARRRRPRRRHRGGAGRHRRPGHVPGGDPGPGFHRFRSARPGPHQAGLRHRLR